MQLGKEGNRGLDGSFSAEGTIFIMHFEFGEDPVAQVVIVELEIRSLAEQFQVPRRVNQKRKGPLGCNGDRYARFRLVIEYGLDGVRSRALLPVERTQ